MDQQSKNSKILKKKRRRMGKKVRFPIMVSLIPERSKYNNMVTFRLRYRDTKTGKIITELGRKLLFRAYGNSSEDAENWEKAEAEKIQAQADVNKYGYTPQGTVTDFFSLFIDVAEEHDVETTRDGYLSSLKDWFKVFIKEEYGLTDKLPFSYLEDGRLLKLYRKYLLKNCKSQNTAAGHLRYVNHVKEVAWNRRLIQQNIKIPTIRQVEVDKDVLTIPEIELLFRTPCRDEMVKRAFIFACICGLSKADLLKLKWSEIDFKADGIVLNTRRRKTGIRVRNHLNPLAYEILNNPGDKDELVFPGMNKDTINYYIKLWVKSCRIDKKITSHNGRHTFAALFLERSDIKSLSIALGHATIAVTSSAYIHISDTKKKKDTSLQDISFNIGGGNVTQIQPGI